jgi:hypothetical protein
MSEYHPDKWLMIKLTNKDNKIHYRIFACWYGGYLGSNSWKLNSGVTRVDKEGYVYSFHGTSGSVYQCHEDRYGTSGYGSGVLSNLIETSKDTFSIEILPQDTNFMELNYE